MTLLATFKDAIHVLNRDALLLSGNELSFRVHYWGIDPCHNGNVHHRHTYYEACYVMEGFGTYEEQDMTFRLTPGTIVLSRPNVWHRIQSESGIVMLYVGFDVQRDGSHDEAIERYEQLNTTRTVWVDCANDTMSATLWRTITQLAAKPPLFGDAITSLCHALLVSFHQLFTNGAGKRCGTAGEPSVTSLTRRAKQYIREHLSSPIPLTEVAQHLHVSPRHLSRLFTTELGTTFSMFIRDERIMRAKQLLAESDKSIKEIADEIGFQSVHYFTRVFKSVCGVPPGEYRIQIASNSESIGILSVR